MAETQHGDLDTREERPGWWVCTCRCSWQSLPHPTGADGRAEAFAVGFMHHRWWNKHPEVEFVGARREIEYGS